MTVQVGSVITLDEQGSLFEAVCEFGCAHQVRPITRRTITIVEEKQVGADWEDAQYGRPQGTTKVSAFRGTDSDGTDWFRDWDGWKGDGPGTYWQAADGRKAVMVYPWDTVEKKYGSKAQSNATGYTFTDLTATKEA